MHRLVQLLKIKILKAGNEAEFEFSLLFVCKSHYHDFQVVQILQQNKTVPWVKSTGHPFPILPH